MFSRLKWASFSSRWKSSSNNGPRGPAEREFWLSATGAPLAVVSVLVWLMRYLPVGPYGLKLPANRPGMSIDQNYDSNKFIT
ncbi:hypothetical protein D3C81_1808310 [compost metagenome]